jgi:peroxiredoxin
MKKPSGQKNLRTALGIGIALLVVAGAAWLHFRGSPDDFVPHDRGKFKAAPMFALPDAAGKSHPLSELKGNVVVLHFWASWCPPCLEEIGAWLKFAEGFQGRSVKFVAVSLDDRWEDAQKVLPAKDLPSNVVSLIDLSKAIPEKYGTYQFPETYLIGPDLTIITKWVGPQGWEQPALKSVIERVAASGAHPSS